MLFTHSLNNLACRIIEFIENFLLLLNLLCQEFRLLFFEIPFQSHYVFHQIQELLIATIALVLRIVRQTLRSLLWHLRHDRVSSDFINSESFTGSLSCTDSAVWHILILNSDIVVCSFARMVVVTTHQFSPILSSGLCSQLWLLNFRRASGAYHWPPSLDDAIGGAI